MSTQVLEKLERMAEIAERIEGLIDKIPRFAEMLGIALFAGRASEKVGGRFEDGAIGGIIADGLAHSQLPNNQIGGAALGVYFASLGLLTVTPESAWSDLPEMAVAARTREECEAKGGIWIETLPSYFGFGIGACRLPDIVPDESGGFR